MATNKHRIATEHLTPSRRETSFRKLADNPSRTDINTSRSDLAKGLSSSNVVEVLVDSTINYLTIPRGIAGSGALTPTGFPPLTPERPAPVHMSSATFEKVKEWIRNSKIPDDILDKSIQEGISVDVDLYEVAGYLRLYDLHNQIIDIIWTYHARRRIERHAIRTLVSIESQGLSHTTMYTLALRSAVYSFVKGKNSDEAWDNDFREFEGHTRVMQDFLIYLRRWTKGDTWKAPGQDDRCDYHIHPIGARCYSNSGPGAPSDEDADPNERRPEKGTSRYGGGPGQPSATLPTRHRKHKKRTSE